MPPIKDITKQEFVYNEIKNRILSNEYSQGKMLSERMMCKELGVSRTPVREAFMRLASTGLVKIIPHQGISVSNFSVENLVELYELREALEKMAIKLFIMKMEDSQVLPLQESLERQKEIVTNEETGRFIDYDIDFHRHITDGSRNKRIAKDLSDLFDLIYLFFPLVASPIVLKKSIKQHEVIIQAISERDVEKAEHAMVEHINYIKNIQVASIKGNVSED